MDGWAIIVIRDPTKQLILHINMVWKVNTTSSIHNFYNNHAKSHEQNWRCSEKLFTAFTDETSSSKEQLIAVHTWLGRMERREELKLKVPT